MEEITTIFILPDFNQNSLESAHKFIIFPLLQNVKIVKYIKQHFLQSPKQFVER